jgi:hypothetical protein
MATERLDLELGFVTDKALKGLESFSKDVTAALKKMKTAETEVLQIAGKHADKIYGAVKAEGDHLSLIHKRMKALRNTTRETIKQLELAKQQTNEVKKQRELEKSIAEIRAKASREGATTFRTSGLGRKLGLNPMGGWGGIAGSLGMSALRGVGMAGAAIGVPYMMAGFSRMNKAAALGPALERDQARLAGLTGTRPAFGTGHFQGRTGLYGGSLTDMSEGLTGMGYDYGNLVQTQLQAANVTGAKISAGQSYDMLRMQRGLGLSTGAQTGFMGGMVRAGASKDESVRVLQKAVASGMSQGLSNARLPEYLQATQNLQATFAQTSSGNATGTIAAMMSALSASVGGKGPLGQPGIAAGVLGGVHGGIMQPGSEYMHGLILRAYMNRGGSAGGGKPLAAGPIEAESLRLKGLAVPGAFSAIKGQLSTEMGGDPRMKEIALNKLSTQWGVGAEHLKKLFTLGESDFAKATARLEKAFKERDKSIEEDLLEGSMDFLNTEAQNRQLLFGTLEEVGSSMTTISKTLVEFQDVISNTLEPSVKAFGNILKGMAESRFKGGDWWDAIQAGFDLAFPSKAVQPMSHEEKLRVHQVGPPMGNSGVNQGYKQVLKREQEARNTAYKWLINTSGVGSSYAKRSNEKMYDYLNSGGSMDPSSPGFRAADSGPDAVTGLLTLLHDLMAGTSKLAVNVASLPSMQGFPTLPNMAGGTFMGTAGNGHDAPSGSD